jgi:hypothetical protein
MESPREMLIPFYLGQGPDIRGRMIGDIHRWDHERLESAHDYIQWLFPLAEPSAFNPDAPLPGPAEVDLFRRDPALRARMVRSFQVMMGFYGLECDDQGIPVRIGQAPDFHRRAQVWLRPGNHNYLRITRILKSLVLLGLEDYARALLAFLEKLYATESAAIGARTLDYWRRAVHP